MKDCINPLISNKNKSSSLDGITGSNTPASFNSLIFCFTSGESSTGSGFIGRGWAIAFARCGYDVRLWDVRPEAALAANWSADALAGVVVDPNDLMADLHSTAEYRANLVKVMAKRAVSAS